MIVTITLTPALDKTVTLPGFAVDKVNRVQSMRLDAGGKGINVSKVLKALGTDSVACGILGGGTGRFIQNSLTEAGIACDFAQVPQDTRTNLKVIDPVNHTNTDINEAGAPVSEETLEEVFARAAAHLHKDDIVVLAGKARALLSGRLAVSEEDIRALALPVLRHRVIMNYRAEAEGVDATGLLTGLLAAAPSC